jgi:hypothetical protein
VTKPILFLDVDGPLNPYQAKDTERPKGYATHRMRPTGWKDLRRKPLRVWLKHSHGADLLALPYELVWATTWQEEANEWIAPHLGLPELPVVKFGTPGPIGTSLHWKTKDLVEYADGRDFLWVDDEVTNRDQQYINANHSGRGQAHWVSSRIGLTDKDFDAIYGWALA